MCGYGKLQRLYKFMEYKEKWSGRLYTVTTTNTVATSATTNLASNSTSYTINSSRLLANLGSGLTKAAIGTASGVVATSVVTGDSITQTIKNQGGANQLLLNIALNAAGEVGAKEIGIAAHGLTDINGNYIVNPIAKSTQLALHAGIGCVMGSQSGNCAAGAAGAVAGEIIAENYFKNQIENNGATIEGNNVVIDPSKTNLTLAQVNEFKLQASQLASLAGGLAAVPFAGSDDASAIYAGSNAGNNSSVNNSLYLGGKYKIPLPGPDYDLHVGIKGDAVFTSVTMGSDGGNKSFNIIPSVGGGIYANAIPHGAQSVGSISYSPIPDLLFIEAIKTNKGMGFGGTLGIFVAPPVKIGVSVTPPEKKSNYQNGNH